METKELIVSAYDKDYSWILDLNPDIKCTVYRKGFNHNNHEIFIENNVGRDVHTFFFHFVKNYDNLSDYTFTSQDYFLDHVDNYMSLINGTTNEWNWHAVQIFSECWFFSSLYPLLICDKSGRPHTDHLDIESVWNELFSNPCPNYFRFTASGHFCISKKHLRKRPLKFYQKILNILENNPQAPWIIERLEPYIFDMNYEIKI